MQTAIPSISRKYGVLGRKNVCYHIDTLMSGSPIIQNGKLAGAVTHVLVQDSTRGYGIFIEEMVGH